MRNVEYWRQRAIESKSLTEQHIAETSYYIDQQYKRAMKDIDEKIRLWYQKFADNNQMTYAEAKKFLSSSELQNFKMDLKDYIKQGKAMNGSIDPAWEKRLKNASAAHHIERFEALRIQTGQAMEVLYGNQLGAVERMAGNVYKENFLHNTFSVQKDTGTAWSVNAIDEKKLSNVIKRPWAPDGKGFSSRIWENKKKMINSLHTAITQSCITGAPVDTVAQELANKLNVAKYNAERLVRTEATHFATEGDMQSYRETGVQQYQYLAALDHTTCELCAEVDNQIFDLKDYSEGETAPPLHSNCRCTTVPYYNDEFTANETRAARDVDGKTVQMPADMSYDEWKKKYVNDSKLLDFDAKSDKIKGNKTSKVSNSNIPVETTDPHYKPLLNKLNRLGVEYNQVTAHANPISESKIIKSLGGGDKTSGSCASLGLAYIGQKSGLNVLDFRGGSSQQFFSNLNNLFTLSNTKGIKTIRPTRKTCIPAGKELLKQCEVGKEYYLCIGRHASIVRQNADNIYQYLELQSPTQNGWMNFDVSFENVLKNRFGCSGKSNSKYFMIDIAESDFSTEEFKLILGYINTAVKTQKKGSLGNVK